MAVTDPTYYQTKAPARSPGRKVAAVLAVVAPIVWLWLRMWVPRARTTLIHTAGFAGLSIAAWMWIPAVGIAVGSVLLIVLDLIWTSDA